MTDAALTTRLSRIQHLLKTVHHVPIATVGNDGAPHNTPVFMAFDLNLTAYWASNPRTQHSQNIMTNDQVYMVVFDSVTGQGGGLYIQAMAQPLIANDADFTQAYEALSELKEYIGQVIGPKEMYLRKGPQRLYRAVPTKLWLNVSTKDATGVVVYDERVEIPLQELQKSLSVDD